MTNPPSDDLLQALIGPDPVAGAAAEAASDLDPLELIPHLGRDHWTSVPRVARLVGSAGKVVLERLLVSISDPSLQNAVPAAYRYMVGVDAVGDIAARFTGFLDNHPRALVDALGECGTGEAGPLLVSKVGNWQSSLTREVLPSALERLFLAQDTDRGARDVRDALVEVSRRSMPEFGLHPAWSVHRMGSGWIDQALALADRLTEESMPDDQRPLGERAVVWLGFSRAARVVSPLTRLAGSAALPVGARVLALQALAENGRDGALAGVARAATIPAPTDPAERSQFLSAVDTATALLAYQTPDLADILVPLLDRADAAGNILALSHGLRRLGQWGPDAEDRLRAKLTHEDAVVRAGAAAGLAAALGPAAIPDIEAVLKESSIDFERTQLLATLARLRGGDGVERLEEHLFALRPMERALWALDQPFRQELLAALATDEQRGAAWAEALHLPNVAPFPDRRSVAERFADARSSFVPILGVTDTGPIPAPSATPTPPPSAAPTAPPGPPSAPPIAPPAPATGPTASRSAGGHGRPNSQTDEPSAVDQLGRRVLVEILASMLDDPGQETPFTLALFGPWGSGKSSVIRQPEDRLTATGATYEWRVAEFNAWRYERTDSLAAGLVQEAVRAIVPQRQGRFRFRLRYAWTTHRGRLVWSLVVLLVSLGAAVFGLVTGAKNDSVAGIFLGLGGVSVFSVTATAFVKLYQHPVSAELMTYFRLPTYGQHLGLLETMRTEVGTLWALARHGRRPTRLLVVVDDLDRCSPKAIASTLDAIRLVMDLTEVVVLIAVDERIGLGAIALEYDELASDARPSADVARDFLAKIVQLPIRLPVPEAIEDYVRGELFPQAGPSNGDRPPAASSSSAEAAPSGRPAASAVGSDPASSTTAPSPSPGFAGGAADARGTYGEDAAELVVQSLLREAMREAPDEVEEFLRLAGLSALNNPRQLRRLRNTYRFTKALAPALEWYPLLTMVFWQELLHSAPLKDHQRQYDGFVQNGDATGPIGRLGPEVGRHLADPAEYAKYRDAVLVAVLPRLGL